MGGSLVKAGAEGARLDRNGLLLVFGVRLVVLMAAYLRRRQPQLTDMRGRGVGLVTLRLMSACAAHSFFLASSRLVRGATDTGTSLPLHENSGTWLQRRAAAEPVLDGAGGPQGVVRAQIPCGVAVPAQHA